MKKNKIYNLIVRFDSWYQNPQAVLNDSGEVIGIRCRRTPRLVGWLAEYFYNPSEK